MSNRDESIFDSIQENMCFLSIWALLPVRGCRVGDKMSPVSGSVMGSWDGEACSMELYSGHAWISPRHGCVCTVQHVFAM